ncbi:hypothetical protein HPB50_006619 [Hyalomma asiaticum]|uniref:Uncharacterized protein n=1 Tax=Hyalomma asiaticum TaxID=266040 RepID=A0ACB7S8A7_HYAAI|nr:hypothetical protein HPB50_006619 [Hyalomma asiaticum]
MRAAASSFLSSSAKKKEKKKKNEAMGVIRKRNGSAGRACRREKRERERRRQALTELQQRRRRIVITINELNDVTSSRRHGDGSRSTGRLHCAVGVARARRLCKNADDLLRLLPRWTGVTGGRRGGDLPM